MPVKNLTTQELMFMSVEEILAAANTPADNRRAKKSRQQSRSPAPQQQYLPQGMY